MEAVATAFAALTPVTVVRYMDAHPRVSARYVALWNHGAEIANRVFNAAVPSLRPEHAGPGLDALKAEIADYRRSGADETIIAAMETGWRNAVRWAA